MRQRLWRGAKPLGLLAAAAVLAACGGGGGGGGSFPFFGFPPPNPGNPTPESSYKAEIRRTSLGVPHIKAADWGGVGYGYGYAQAEDNLCTMADSFLTYRGERSRYFGAEAKLVYSSTISQPLNIDSDFFHKHVMSADVIAAMVQAQPEKLKKMVEGFAAGYNRYLRDARAAGSAHAACLSQEWVKPIIADDIFRRMYAANLAGGYSNFLPLIARSEAPAAAAPQKLARRDARRAEARVLASLRARPLEQVAMQVGGHEGVGSNMFGFGTAGTGTDSPLLFGNPHWYWRGPDRFYQAQLTIPGELDVSGTSFLGIPVILIGFNDNVAWSHTVSTARRFGLFQLTPAAGDPTSYMRDGQAVKMKATTLTVEVKGGTQVQRTLYKSEYGPIVDMGLRNKDLAWGPHLAFAIRDINADNFRTFRNWMRWNQAKSLDDFIAIQREEAAIPWVNTVAVGRGSAKAWYADIGAVPNVSAEQMSRCVTPIGQAVSLAAGGAPVLDGSKSACDWQTDPDSAQKGAIGPARMPSLLRDDYVANMNDSYWLSNPDQPLTGFPPIFGPTEYAQTLRTRLGHLMARARIAGTDAHGPAKASVDSVKQMVLDSRSYSAERFKARVLELVCTAPAAAPAAAGAVDTAAACAALKDWDNTGSVNAQGAHIWDEFWYEIDSLSAGADLFAQPFDKADPLNTPSGLKDGAADKVREAFATALQHVNASGLPARAVRGDYLYATRNGQKIPLYGGCDWSGYFTITCSEHRIDEGFYNMDGDPNGNSYMQIVSFPKSGVEAHTFLTFSLSDDPASPRHANYTRAYANKQWLRVPFTEAQITADPAYRTTTVKE